MTTIAVVIVGIWLVLFSQGPVNTTLTLVIGVVVAAFALLDFFGVAVPLAGYRRGPQ